MKIGMESGSGGIHRERGLACEEGRECYEEGEIGERARESVCEREREKEIEIAKESVK